jgi:lipopolysaccharide transport system ATP-binding protein
MSDVAHEGRTVLFVSHNMAAVRAICSSALYLAHGKVVERGPAADVLALYARRTAANAESTLTFDPSPTKPRFVGLEMLTPTVEYGGTVEVKLRLQSPLSLGVAVELEIHDERGAPIAYTSTAPKGTQMVPLRAGEPRELTIRLGPLALATGQYAIYFWMTRPWAEEYHAVPAPLTFEVVHSDPCGSGFDFRQDYNRGAFTVPLQVAHV